MRTVSSFIGKYMALIVLAVSVLALFKPETRLWIRTGSGRGICLADITADIFLELI